MAETTHGDGFVVVRITPDEVRKFNSQWPGSRLNEDLHYLFEFDYDGNLVDLWGRKSMHSNSKHVDLSKYDSQELFALSQDAWDLAKEYLNALSGAKTKSNPTYKDLYFVDNVNKTMKLIRYGSPEHDQYYRLQSSSRMLVPAASNMFYRLVASGYKIVNPYVGFKTLSRQLEQRGAYDPKALAAWIGRRKYGKSQFQRMAVEGRRNPHTDMDGMALVETGLPGTKPVWKTLSFSGYKNAAEAVSDFAMWLRSKIPLLRGYKLISGGEVILEREIPDSMSVSDVQDQIRMDAQAAKRRL